MAGSTPSSRPGQAAAQPARRSGTPLAFSREGTGTPDQRRAFSAACPGSEITVAAARRALAGALREVGIETPELDARLLMQHALGLDHGALAAAAERKLSAQEGRRLDEFAARRLAREPLAYITGEKEFWSLPLRVSGDTLTPRPETETVVEAALSVIADRHAALRIADLGVGSGAILLALLSELPNAFGVALDRSAAAIAVARTNAERLGVAPRILFCVGDFAAPLGGMFDLVVSNPPYVAHGEFASLASEVRDHEPRLALYGGGDGLSAYHAIARDAARVVAPGGFLVLEIGHGQEPAVGGIFAERGMGAAGPALADLAGTPRALILRQK